MAEADSVGPHPWLTPQLEALVRAIAGLSDPGTVALFLRDLCTRRELEAMAQRFEVARLVDRGTPYLEVSHRTGASTATVTRVAQWLRHGEGGYRAALALTAGAAAPSGA